MPASQLEFSAFDAKQFALNHGMYINFRFDITTNIISQLEGNIADKLAISSLEQMGIYTSLHIEQIKNVILKNAGSKNVTKLMFVMLDEQHNTQMLHNLFIESNAVAFNISCIKDPNEQFLKLLFVSRWNDASKMYIAKSVYRNLTDSFELQNYQYEVLRLLVQGFSAEKIAQILGRSVHTINDYKKQLFELFQANSIYQLLRHAREKEII